MKWHGSVVLAGLGAEFGENGIPGKSQGIAMDEF
jgi:hypothetical protein